MSLQTAFARRRQPVPIINYKWRNLRKASITFLLGNWIESFVLLSIAVPVLETDFTCLKWRKKLQGLRFVGKWKWSCLRWHGNSFSSGRRRSQQGPLVLLPLCIGDITPTDLSLSVYQNLLLQPPIYNYCY